MDSSTIPSISTTNTVHGSCLDRVTSQCEQLIQQYWADNPDLYRMIQLKHQQKSAANEATAPSGKDLEQSTIDTLVVELSPINGILRGAPLCAKIRESQQEIRQKVLTLSADITPRTQAHNRKCLHDTVDEERDSRADVVSAQIQSWRSMLPTLIKRFSKIPDYRRAGSIKHSMTVLMLFGLFAFVFRLSSRREMNRELTSPVIFEHLQELFPDINTIPHADTLARLLKKMA